MSGILDPQAARGNIVRLSQTNVRHLSGKVHEGQQTTESGSKDFGTVLSDALNGVNDLTQQSGKLTQQFITNPDSVDPHDVTIASSKADLAVSMTKSVVDEALKAYRDIINLR